MIQLLRVRLHWFYWHTDPDLWGSCKHAYKHIENCIIRNTSYSLRLSPTRRHWASTLPGTKQNVFQQKVPDCQLQTPQLSHYSSCDLFWFYISFVRLWVKSHHVLMLHIPLNGNKSASSLWSLSRHSICVWHAGLTKGFGRNRVFYKVRKEKKKKYCSQISTDVFSAPVLKIVHLLYY